MMTSSRQRRSPKSKDPSSENAGSGLTVQDGSQESLVGMSTKVTSSSSPASKGLALPLPRKRRRKVHGRTSLSTERRLRFCLLFSVITFLLVACFYILENHKRGTMEQEYQDQGTGSTNTLEERFSAVGTGPTCTAPLTAEDVSYTLVTQFSHDRLWMMEQHCARWGPHPMSIAVLTNQTVDSIQEELTGMGCLSEHYISVQTLSPPSLQDSPSDYPVNVLRNMALTKVETSHVAYVDVDFWESTDLHTNLMQHHVRDALALDHKAALVLPAFQMLRQCRELRECPEKNSPVMPHNKEDLLDLFHHKNATQFDPSNRGGHGSTRYKDWMDQSNEELLPISCVLSHRYEPYLVVRYCDELPPFQTAFSGYGKNKMTWVMQLVRSGYAFWQLGESFLVHYPHLDSNARLQWNGGPHGEQLSKPESGSHLADYKRAQTDQTFTEFREWLYAKVPDETRIPPCDEAMDDDAKLWVPREETYEDDEEYLAGRLDHIFNGTDEEEDDNMEVEAEEEEEGEEYYATDEETDGLEVEAEAEEEEESPADNNGENDDGDTEKVYL
jgi:hypothetical protein